MKSLEVLASARPEILKTEVAALLHNLGKLSKAFLAYQRHKARKEAGQSLLSEDLDYEKYKYQAIAGIVAEHITSPGRSLSSDDWGRLESSADAGLDYATSKVLTEAFRNWLRKPGIDLPVPLNDRQYAPGDFIEFQSFKWYEPRSNGSRILLLRPGGSKATELLEAAHDAASGSEKKEAGWPKSQTEVLTYRATAFGNESSCSLDKLEEEREYFTREVLKNRRDLLFAVAHNALVIGLADTQRPINDVTLWDISHSVAGLHKAALAKVIMEGAWGTLPHGRIKWRLLGLAFDGPAFWGQAHHVTDLLGRRKVIQDGLNAVRELLEVTYPLGNEVYRDENGSVFVVPDIDDLLSCQNKSGESLKTLLGIVFDGKGLRGELWSDIKMSMPYEGKKIKLAETIKNRLRINQPVLEKAAYWWSTEQRPNNAEICTVCGLRPVGYMEAGLNHWVKENKAKNRNVCGVCLDRRGRRAHEWAQNKKTLDEKVRPFDRTIWIDEVADQNGRFALVVGRFNLDGWLSGQLIETLRKSPSFARIRRCWETTYQFWLDVQDEVVPKNVGERIRFGIQPANTEQARKMLGKCHAYETEINGRRLGLCWDPDENNTNTHNLFWTTDNLAYFSKLTKTSLLEAIENRTLPIYEPGGYLGQIQRADVDAEQCKISCGKTFHPFIPLMVAPASFMALVPADCALAVVKEVKKKYGEEMGRVRDRLPLHLGIVFAPRRTPLRAVLDTGEAMLKMPDRWEKWKILSKDGHKVSFGQRGQTFSLEYPNKMGDEKTDDSWYPHLLLKEPTNDTKLESCHINKLDKAAEVFIRPSRFDFVFLDTTGRRFEIRYGKEGRRIGRRTRPFLLEDLDRFSSIWGEIKRLAISQRYQVIDAIEATREAWHGRDVNGHSLNDPVFKQFVKDTLGRAAWRKHSWKNVEPKLQKKIVEAGVTGELADLAELYMEILKEKVEEA